jgi:hypothetical protein
MHGVQHSTCRTWLQRRKHKQQASSEAP